ncbi:MULTISPECIES: erythromycin esterase family protein [Variovorax]|uniref:erythromycin esterase family protein n=1 Tax=Variovorax TaxID=34072 RepID=UPI00285CB0E0|nr:erythromycin esterase family protein [Variovorax sp. 3319]MDR6888092.1 erythromycin esterase-like protein [Variovorax sp. 3319]
MKPSNISKEAEALRSAAHPLEGNPCDHDALLDLIGDAHYVLLGEASHGTQEFYAERANITRRLLAEKGFNAVAIEGDWPDAYRVNRYVRGTSDDASAAEALAGFRRFPTWMWRNEEVARFVEWQRAFNDSTPPQGKTGFYGLDLYSLSGSMEAVLAYFERTDPDAARLARERYGCFDRYGDRGQNYGLMAGLGNTASCQQAVVDMLLEMRRAAGEAWRSGNAADEEDAFNAEQNARLVKNAEAYYRSMYLSDVSSWNLRDRHMVETLGEVERHLWRGSERPKIVVWAHNSHLGDARATEMGEERGELNVGQLVRERQGRDAVLVGFTTHTGTVMAASDWGAPAERKHVVPSRPDSYEWLLHETGLERFMLPLRGEGSHFFALREQRLERAIGVIYRPETERQSHYFFARLPVQFDALLHIDRTHAVEPLDRGAATDNAGVPETYPSGK